MSFPSGTTPLRSWLGIGTPHCGPIAQVKSDEVLAKFPETACLRARLINPVLKQQPLLSRDREGAVPFARFSRILQVPLQLAQGSETHPLSDATNALCRS